MSFDWNTIGKKISSLYEEMEYHPEYTIERFEDDLEAEKRRDGSKIPKPPINVSDYRVKWISWFRHVLESRRSILTKLFSLTNNLHSVDTLVEYCDYYKSYYADTIGNTIPGWCLLFHPVDMLHSVFMAMTKNATTERVIIDVWEMLTEAKWSRQIDLSVEFGPCAIVIMGDADLDAAVRALVMSRSTYFEVSRVLVQEPIKEQLLSRMESYGFKPEVLSNLYVFRNTAEALGNLSGKRKSKAFSIWSENIIAAKKFAAIAKIDTIWINAHGVLSPGLYSLILKKEVFPINSNWTNISQRDEHPARIPLKTYDLFYGGKWEIPINGKYWINPAGVAYAEATGKDFSNCVNAARGGFKLWSSKKLSQRLKVIRNFAERLRANGDFEHADTVLQLLERPLAFGTSLSIVRDGEAEVLSTPEPIGVVLIASDSQKMLFAKLIIAAITGNAVIVVLVVGSSYSFAPYCDLLATCGFPPGAINYLLTDLDAFRFDLEMVDGVLFQAADLPPPGISDLCDSKSAENILYNKMFVSVTKPKSIWLQCG